MKAKIDKDGWLWLERAGKFKKQYCLFQNENNDLGQAKCGDWCPLFGKIETNYDLITSEFKIEICQNRILHFDEIIDERNQK